MASKRKQNCDETNMNELIDQFTYILILKKCTNSMNTFTLYMSYIYNITYIYAPENQLNPTSIKYSAHTKQMYHEKYDLKIKEYRQDMNS